MSGRNKRPAPTLYWIVFALFLGTIAIFIAGFFAERSSAAAPSLSTAAMESTVLETLPPTTQPPTQPLVKNRVNLLLIGQDARQSGETSRSDAMVLCSFHPGTKTVTLISFLRDLYVQIPGHAPNRLNAAYAFGGAALLKQTFAQNFGITLDGCVEVDFQQFARLVDLMGGVELELRKDEAGLLSQLPDSRELSEGYQRLDGNQALAYVRIRNLDADGDFSRTLRQRKLLTALLDQLRHCSPGKVLTLLARIDELVSTDLTGTRLAAYAASFLPLLKDGQMKQLRIPADGSYSPGTVDGMAVLIADPEMTRSLLATALEDP